MTLAPPNTSNPIPIFQHRIRRVSNSTLLRSTVFYANIKTLLRYYKLTAPTSGKRLLRLGGDTEGRNSARANFLLLLCSQSRAVP